MAKTENAKKFSLIAAICYTIYALYNIINRYSIYNRIYNSTISASNSHVPINALIIIVWIAALGMAVTLFMKNKKAVVAAAGVNALLGAYYIIRCFGLWNLCIFVAYAGAVVLIALSIKALKQNDYLVY